MAGDEHVEQKNSRKIGSKTRVAEGNASVSWIVSGTWLDRVVTFQYFQLRPPILNLSCTKINFAFGAGHVTRLPMYILRLLKLSLSPPSLSLSQLDSFHTPLQPRTFRQLQIETRAIIGEHTPSKTTFITIDTFAKLQCSRLCMNFKIAPYIHTFC